MLNVHPEPTDEELAALMSAMAVLWPGPSSSTVAAPEPPSRWRFASRPWLGRTSYGGWR